MRAGQNSSFCPFLTSTSKYLAYIFGLVHTYYKKNNAK